jgi:glutamate-ammonia-ligase adenylyltransferase
MAPRLAEALSRHPLLLDAVLDHAFFTPLPERAALVAELGQRLESAGDVQDLHELARRWVNEANFRIGVQSLRDMISAPAAGRAHSDVADAVIQVLLPTLEKEFALTHGRCPGDGFAVVALGKFGGRELTAGSDLDLVFLYDVPPGDGVVMSDGAKPLSASHHYQRFSQRVINALTALTGEGRLYQVDTRLRPQGNAGPLATSLEAFARYYSEEAWTWEHLALTRARVVAAAPAFAERITVSVRAVLAVKRDPRALLAAVADMRRKIDAQFHTDVPWLIKYYRGGLIDCEFIAQYLQLRHAHGDPNVVSANTIEAYDRLARAGALDAATAAELREATALWLAIQAWLRLTVVEERPDETAWPAPLKAGLARVGGADDFAALKDKVLAVAARTLHHYERLIEQPAAAIESAPEARGKA